MNERGFTLLEVMVALAIFATASLALFSALQHVTANSAGLSERSQAMWLADNYVNELRVGLREVHAGSQQQTQQFGGRNWQLFGSVSASAYPGLWQVQVQVSPAQATAPRSSHRAELFALIEMAP